MNPMRSLPVATAAARASSRRPSSRVLSRCTSASIAARFATLAAAAAPTPSASAASRGLSDTAASLLPRTGPTSVRSAQARLRPVTAGTVASAPRSLHVGPDPLGEERLGDPRPPAVAPDQLVACERLDRLLRRGDRAQRVAAAVVLGERVARLAGERLQDQLLVARRAVPEQAEVRVLGAQQAVDCRREPLGRRDAARRRLLPEEVAELLRRVRVAAGDA